MSKRGISWGCFWPFGVFWPPPLAPFLSPSKLPFLPSHRHSVFSLGSLFLELLLFYALKSISAPIILICTKLIFIVSSNSELLWHALFWNPLYTRSFSLRAMGFFKNFFVPIFVLGSFWLRKRLFFFQIFFPSSSWLLWTFLLSLLDFS